MKHIRAYTAVAPEAITVASTGEIVDHREFTTYFRAMVCDIQKMSQTWLDDVVLTSRVLDSLVDKERVQAQEVGRQLAVGSSAEMPTVYPQPYRTLKMARDNYIRSCRSYALNQQGDRGGKPRAGAFLSYGSCDRQVTRIEPTAKGVSWFVLYQGGVWVRADFHLPMSMSGYSKVCQPTLRLDHNGNLRYNLSLEYDVAKPSNCPQYYLGVDLGKVEPYVATLVDSSGNPMSTHHACPQTQQTNVKRRRISALIATLSAKRERLQQLGEVVQWKVEILDREIARQIASRGRKEHAIAKETGVEIARIAHQNNAEVGIEDLRWLASKGGKWKHSITAAWIEHKSQEQSVNVTRVSAYRTSKTCPKCRGNQCVSRDRNIICLTCSTTVNRDVAASTELARRVRDKTGPTRKRPRKKVVQQDVEPVEDQHSPHVNGVHEGVQPQSDIEMSHQVKPVYNMGSANLIFIESSAEYTALPRK